jgi:arsenate reductase (thioredoxin)
MPIPAKVLFVCVGNCVRSQMAEALARHKAPDAIEAESAGVHPLGFIDETARAVLEEQGISMDGQFSKGLHIQMVSTAHLIVNMSGMPSSRLFPGRPYEDWAIADPFGEDLEVHRRICDDIAARILELATRLREGSAEAQ